MFKVVKLIEAEITMLVPEAEGGENGKLLFHEHRDSVIQDKKFQRSAT
jgi:hypothetical protein